MSLHKAPGSLNQLRAEKTGKQLPTRRRTKCRHCTTILSQYNKTGMCAHCREVILQSERNPRIFGKLMGSRR